MHRSKGKRCKERCLEEAVHLLRQTSSAQLGALEDKHLLLLVRLLLSLQLELVCISSACRKVDKVSYTFCSLFYFIRIVTKPCKKLSSAVTDAAAFGRSGPPVSF